VGGDNTIIHKGRLMNNTGLTTTSVVHQAVSDYLLNSLLFSTSISSRNKVFKEVSDNVLKVVNTTQLSAALQVVMNA